MDEKPDQIVSHIESQRDQLGRNLNELESRVRRTTDWRAQFDRNPMLLMGVALGGGILLGTMTSGSRRSSQRTTPWSQSSRYYGSPASRQSPAGSSSYSGPSGYGASAGMGGAMGISSNLGSGASQTSTPSSPAVREQKRKATDTLEHMKAALIGFATAKLKEFMTEALPGFNQHLDDAERRQNELHGRSHEESSSQHTQQGSSSYGQPQSTSQTHSPTGRAGGAQTGASQPGSSSNTANTRTEQSSTENPRRQEPVSSGLNI